MSFKYQAAAGMKWTGLAAIFALGLQIGQVCVLARLLTPRDFGLMAMLSVVVGLAQVYADTGISNAIICQQNVTERQLSSLYWLNFAAGLAIYSLLYLASPLVAAFYHEPRLKSLLRLLIILFLLNPVGQQFQVLLQKELRFKALGLSDISSAGVGFLVAVTTAQLGYGVYALIWGSLSAAGTRSILLRIVGAKLHRIRLRFDWKDTRGFLSFGAYQMGERTISYLSSNMDKLIIGRLLGSDALGLYNLAWYLVVQPESRINPVVTRVVFPVFARLQGQPEALKQGFLKVLRMLSTVNFPALLGLAAVAPVLIPVMFGQKWLPAVGLVQILAFVSISRSIADPVGSLLLAKGRADLGFKWNLALFVLQSMGVAIGASLNGVIGVAWSLLLLQAFYSLLSYPWLIRTLIGPCGKAYLASILPAFWVSSSMGLLLCAGLEFLTPANLDRRLVLSAAISCGVIYYLFATWLVRRNDFAEFMKSAGLHG
jgi:lipopolysaccharide exporter